MLEKRAAQLEKQLARLCAALGPAAVAAAVEASENGSETGAPIQLGVFLHSLHGGTTNGRRVPASQRPSRSVRAAICSC